MGVKHHRGGGSSGGMAIARANQQVERARLLFLSLVMCCAFHADLPARAGADALPLNQDQPPGAVAEPLLFSVGPHVGPDLDAMPSEAQPLMMAMDMHSVEGATAGDERRPDFALKIPMLGVRPEHADIAQSPEGNMKPLTYDALVREGLRRPSPVAGENARPASDYDHQVALTDMFLARLEAKRLFSGSIAIAIRDRIVYNQNFGYSSFELQSRFKSQSTFPVGSCSRLFVAIAINQLALAGVIKLTDTIDTYLDPDELGFKTPYCPQIYGPWDEPPTPPPDGGGGAAPADCAIPTILHLLTMTSGFADVISCHYDENSWMARRWCFGRDGPFRDSVMGLVTNLDFMMGRYLASELVRLVIRAPLWFAPGAMFDDSDVNYWFLQHIIEKVTRMPYGAYVERNILIPAGLTFTRYDPSGGVGAVFRNSVEGPGYYVTVRDGAEDQFLRGGEMHVGRYPVFEPYDFGLAAASGAIYTRPTGIIKLITTLLQNPSKLKLTQETVQAMLTPPEGIFIDNEYTNATEEDRLRYAQGIAVFHSSAPPSGVIRLFAPGDMQGFTTMVHATVNVTDGYANIGTLVYSRNVKFVHPTLDADTCTLFRDDHSPNITQPELLTIPPDLCDMFKLNPNGFDYVARGLSRIWPQLALGS